jgi:hypothetical protein
MRVLSFVILALCLLTATAAQAKMPFFNATCPGGIEVHADAGGPVYVNGNEAKLKTFNANYYEATYQRTTLSISVNPDGTADVSYKTRGGGNGVCTLADDAASDGAGNASPGGMTAAQMTAYCKGEAAGQYNTRPSNVKADAPIKAVGGGFVVSGSVSLGSKGNPPFQCLFDAGGNFTSINWL